MHVQISENLDPFSDQLSQVFKPLQAARDYLQGSKYPDISDGCPAFVCRILLKSNSEPRCFSAAISTVTKEVPRCLCIHTMDTAER